MLGSLRFMNQNDFKQKVAATKYPKNSKIKLSWEFKVTNC